MTVLNYQELLKPISASLPSGKNLRLEHVDSSIYQKIKDARGNARKIERAHMQKNTSQNNNPNWDAVYELALEALTEKSKDLEIATWLTEALLRKAGFAGLSYGFSLLRQLIEHYWETVYPHADEDGLVTKIASIGGLNGYETEGTLVIPIGMIPLTEGQTAGPYALWQYQQALELLTMADTDKKNQRIASGVICLELFEIAAKETNTDFFEKRINDIQASISEFKLLNHILNEKCGTDAPPSSRIQQQLDACLDCIKHISKNHLAPLSNQKNKAETPVNMEQKQTISCSYLNSTDREQVLQNLLNAANFFRMTEPHSPLSYLLEKTVRWGRLTLPELLKELIHDEQIWNQICYVTGINYKT